MCKHRPFFVIVALILVWELLNSCTPQPASAPSTGQPSTPSDPLTQGTATPTPFSPAEPTATPGDIYVWISPAIPNGLSQQVRDLEMVGGRSLQLVAEAEDADIRVESNPETALTHWIYAVVAPFPTLADDISMTEIREAAQGEPIDLGTFFLREEHAALIAEALGLGTDGVSILSGSEDLCTAVWDRKPAFSLLPFEELAPRWKVLAVDGLSPIQKAFDAESYALRIAFGLSGDPEAKALLAANLDWPASNRDPEKLTVVAMTGVTALTRATAWKMEQNGVLYPAEKIIDWLQDADITHISNEVSFYADCPAPNPVRQGLQFCSDPKYIELFEAVGVDVIELTGNHIKDYGQAPFDQTLEMYAERGWSVFAGGQDLEQALQPLLVEHHGNKLAFLGCNQAGPPHVLAREGVAGGAPCQTDVLFAELARLRQEGYLTIFTYQWNEYPLAAPPTDQVLGFEAAAEAGATIVSGSQAHEPMGFEFLDESFIHYGVGNLFFDQMWFRNRRAFIDQHVFYDGRHLSTELLTIMLEDYAQPRPMTIEERDQLLEEMFAASRW